jgi:protein-disulfide isomerase
MSSRGIWLVVGLVAVAVAVLVAVGLRDDPTSDTVAGTTIQGTADVTTELEGLAQSGNRVGDADAPVTIVEYGDLACPACKLASETTVPDTIERFVRTGRASLAFRPIAFISPSSDRGALAAEAAAEQDAMWSLVGLLYRNQGDEGSDWLTTELLEAAVVDLGLDLAVWRRDYGSDAIAQRAAEREVAAERDEVHATPTFVVSGPAGTRTIEGVVSADEIQEAIEAVDPS